MASQSASVSAILKAFDVAATIEWYRQVGFEVRGVFPDEGEPTWCELSRDGVILQFLGGDETPWPGPPAFTGTLYFHPDSVGALRGDQRPHRACMGTRGPRMGYPRARLEGSQWLLPTFTEPA